ncbi:MAG: NUDIX domain-containing protein [Treponema sp.]|nr:MAG: NUDIX domain-containing protein [Treponema sp.]
MSSSIACIVYKNGKILIAHRIPKGDMGNRWEFPGGKLDAGEDDKTAIIREMDEEFGVKAVPGEKIASCSFVHKGKECFLNAYFVQLEHDGLEKPFVLTEHTEYKWVFPREIESLNFVDSDLKIYPEVLHFLEK